MQIRLIILALLFAVEAGATGIQALDRDEANTVAMLIDRVENLNALWVDEQYGEVYELLSSRYRLGDENKKQYIRDAKKSSRRVEISRWEIVSIRLFGKQAEVTLMARGRIKEGLVGWEDVSEKVYQYWIFENNNWYKNLSKPASWNDIDAHEIPLPENRNGPGHISIKSKN